MASTDLVGSVKDLIGQADKSSARKVNKELGKDAFLQLLVSQLKHQDPMKPMDDTSFIAEMAQFSSLEQMQNMNKLLEAQQSFGQLSQASNMIGKYVTIQLPGEEAQIVTGKVEEVRSMAGQINVVIDGKPYNSVDIRQVSDKPTK
ncbi:Basal-body rod modification protein FlgD [compost metagenome]